MKVQLSFRNVSEVRRRDLRGCIQRLADEKIERHIADLSPELIRLHGRIMRNPHRRHYHIELRLKVASDVLVSREEGPGLERLTKEACEELERQLRRYLDRRKQTHLWERPLRRQRLRSALKTSASVQEQAHRRLYFQLVEDHLDDLYCFVRREVIYLEDAAEVAPGALAADDITDEAVLRGYERFTGETPSGDVRQWLYGIAAEVLTEALEEQREFGGASLLSQPPQGPAAEPTLHDEEILQYHTPDERLRLEDLVPLPEGQEDPERAVAWREAQYLLQRAIAQLPRQWRQAVVLVGLEGLDEADAAMVLGERPEHIGELLRYARAYLRARLDDAGLPPETFAGDLVKAVAATGPTPAPLTLRRDLESILLAKQ